MKVKIPPYRTENGRKIFTIDAKVDAARRVASDAGGGRRAQIPPAGNQAADPAAGGMVNPDEVRVRFRLLSAVDAWPTMGWLGPQLVRYGHNDGAAIRQLPDLINNRPRPLPLMWNHSFDIHDKAGKVERAEWEQSGDIPPGVNGELVVNRNYDPKAAIGLETGELDATSICVHFDMEMSHPDMDFTMFWDLAGDAGMPHEVDGRIVAWLPVAATEAYHHALVWAGADSNSGPRNEEAGSEPSPLHNEEQHAAAQSGTAANNNTEGGQGVMDKIIALCAAVLNALGIDAVLGDKGEVPSGLHDRVTEKLAGLLNLRDQYNALASKLQSLEKGLLKEGETSLSAAEIVERLPGIVDMAKYGEAYLSDLRNSALGWFDKAKVDPSKPELSNEAKQIRAVIAACTSVEQLKAYVVEYQQAAEKRFGPVGDLRISAQEELPGNSGQAHGADSDIGAAVARMFPAGGGAK